MIRLAISSSSSKMTVAIEKEGKIKELEYDTKYPCESLIFYISQLIESQSKRLECKEVLVDAGPGSFTGIRIGIATANALGMAYQAPVFGYSSLDLLAVSAVSSAQQVPSKFKIGINAGRSMIFCAHYSCENEKLRKESQDFLLDLSGFIDLPFQALGGYRLPQEMEINAISPKASDLFCLRDQSWKDYSSNGFAIPHYVRDSGAVFNPG